MILIHIVIVMSIMIASIVALVVTQCNYDNDHFNIAIVMILHVLNLSVPSYNCSGDDCDDDCVYNNCTNMAYEYTIAATHNDCTLVSDNDVYAEDYDDDFDADDAG